MFLTCFSYFSRYFLILVFLRNRYLLILSLRGSTLYMRPQNLGTARWFCEVRRFLPFLPKVSRANVRWANANHPFLTHKNRRTDTFSRNISPAELCSTARVWNPQGISNSLIKVDCYVPPASRNAIVRAFLATKPSQR
jgi:hypothetical protein